MPSSSGPSGVPPGSLRRPRDLPAGSLRETHRSDSRTLRPVDRLHRHLESWLGRWPGSGPIDVVGSVARERPGWDGRIFPVIGVRSPESGVLSVPRQAATAVASAATAAARCTADNSALWDDLLLTLPALLGEPGWRVYQGIFRWCERPAPLPDAGVWVESTDPSLPEWLRHFGSREREERAPASPATAGNRDRRAMGGHEVLVATDPDRGGYAAGVGIKHHDFYGREIAVGTAPHAQGRGLARALVAQAARRILDEGAVPTYQHDPGNVASARVADAAGFPDRGWRSATVA